MAWGSAGLNTNIVSCKHNVGDLIHAAYATHQLAHILPHLEILLQTARMILVAESPCLEDTLVLLVEAHSLPNASPEVKRSICRIMNQWVLMPIPVVNDMVVWSDEPQPARIGSNSRDVVLMGVGQLTQQRLYTSDVSPAAAVQLSSPSLTSSQTSASPGVPNPAEPAHNVPQVCPLVCLLDNAYVALTCCTMLPAYVTALHVKLLTCCTLLTLNQKQIWLWQQQWGAVRVGQVLQCASRLLNGLLVMQETAADDFISRAEAEKAVAAAVSKEREDADKMIKVLTRRPNDKWMVRNYCRRHTNYYHHDFNAEMVKKRQQKLETEQANMQPSEDVDVCIFSSILATVDDADNEYI